ncbi:hypothetical protein A3D03_05290 [Candidatus Gottesmanbacteria bacterium RIFCSPHIGHO2_02_FULL_40_13]|uniref:Uncharacterized protein n=1 Tax=Candidatus Gottesmanbacteria bacterium RIFCSPHIGHO2_02_FULL_40_13 TaxID=1798384 RepID=A0A1F6A8H8_9BACT|nr:MAG: hypothetical protein A3D03_05290 [Candidatus Gottesmanbacteria bacterium RIFCSPHIGHO2_02_FULL_40_13]
MDVAPIIPAWANSRAVSVNIKIHVFADHAGVITKRLHPDGKIVAILVKVFFASFSAGDVVDPGVVGVHAGEKGGAGRTADAFGNKRVVKSGPFIDEVSFDVREFIIIHQLIKRSRV